MLLFRQLAINNIGEPFIGMKTIGKIWVKNFLKN